MSVRGRKSRVPVRPENNPWQMTKEKARSILVRQVRGESILASFEEQERRARGERRLPGKLDK